MKSLVRMKPQLNAFYNTLHDQIQLQFPLFSTAKSFCLGNSILDFKISQ
jgi:hypothetical protein